MDSRAQTVVKISSPADIVGVVPFRVGFHPTESIVLLCLQGSRRRDRLVLRQDLVDAEDEPALAADLVERVALIGADEALLICYTADADPEPGCADASARLARGRLVDAVRTGLRGRGIAVPEALLVRDRRWWSYLCGDPDCCPAEGTPLPEGLTPAAGRLAAAAVADGQAVLADRDELARSILPARNPVAREVRWQAVRAAMAWHDDLIGRGGTALARRSTVALVRNLLDRWSTGSRELSADQAARVVVGLEHRPTRDEVGTLLLESDRGVFLALLVALTRHVDGSLAAPLCSVLAWVAHANGDGALANVAVERALRAQPGYELALLIEEGLDRMITPAEVLRLTRCVRDEMRVRSA